MSFFFGKGTKVKPSYTGLQLQTASSTQPITLLWGGNRVSMNLIWYDDFRAHKKKQKAGKGMGGSSTYYTYSASIQGGLCEGPIHGVGRVFKDDEKTTLSKLGMSLFLGTYPQAPWGYLTTRHPTKALGYEGVSYVAIANYDLGQSASLGNHTFEVFGREYNTAIKGHDSDCAILVKDFLTNDQYGAGFGLNRLDQEQLFSTPLATTTGDSSYQTYCRAMGFGLSPALVDPQEAGTILAQWALLTNSAIVWNGYKLKLVPYARDKIVANGVTYVPPQLSAPAYYITDADVLEDPEIERVDQSTCPNVVTLNINNRFNEYNELPVPFKDQTLIDQFGERKGNDINAPEVTDPDMAAEMVSLICARGAYVRNIYTLRLGQEYALLEPMDTLVLTNSNGFQVLLQITNIEEDDDYKFTIEAEEIANNVVTTGGFVNPGTTDPSVINSGVVASPVNTPIIFEPPADMSDGVAQIWCAVSGGNNVTADPNWGGCEVYVSLDNITYQSIGIIDSPARQGKLTAPFTSSGLGSLIASVDLTMSQGELQAVSPLEQTQEATLSIVDSEFFTYQTAALTDTYKYALGLTARGLHGTATANHPTGAPFARLDENIFKYQLPQSYIGQPLYLKFQSFNIWNRGYQEMEDVVAYSYTPVGTGFKIGPPTSVALAFASTVQTDGTTVLKGTVTVGASSGPYLDHYDVQVTTDGGATWQDISAINASGTNTSFQPAVSSTNYRARSRAVSSATGGIPSEWVLSPVVNSGALGGVAPNPPTAIIGSGGVLSNNVGWVPPAAGSPPTKYNIYGKLGASGTPNVLVGSVGYGVTYFTHVGLNAEETWRYIVKAANGAGESAALGPIDLTTLEAGGGSGSVAVQSEGTDVVPVATAINFVGDGVSVEEDPTGVAKITINGGVSAAFELLISATGTGTPQNISIPAGYSADQLLVFSGALFFPDFTLTGSTVTLTTNAPGDVVKIYAMVAGSTIGSGKVGYYAIPRFRPNAGIGFSANNCGGRVITFQEDMEITDVAMFCTLANSTAVIRAAIYSVSPTGTIANLLASGPQKTGPVWGINEYALDTPYSVKRGEQLFVGVQILTSNTTLAQIGDTIDAFYFGSSGALPASNPAGVNYGTGTSMSVWPKVKYKGGGGSGKPWYWSPPLASSFSVVSGNAVLPVISDDEDVGFQMDFVTAVSGDTQKLAYGTLTDKTKDWELTARIDVFMMSDNFAQAGLGFRDSVGGRVKSFSKAGPTATAYEVIAWPGLTGYTSGVARNSAFPLRWFRISRVGSTLNYYVSSNGKFWQLVYSESVTSWLANPPDQVGFFINTNRTVYPPRVFCEYFSLTGPAV